MDLTTRDIRDNPTNRLTLKDHSSELHADPPRLALAQGRDSSHRIEVPDFGLHAHRDIEATSDWVSKRFRS